MFRNNPTTRGGKMSWFEGGIRTSAWVTGGVLPPPMRGKNLSSAHPIAICDWHSTFIALAGADDGSDGAQGVPKEGEGDERATGGGTLPLPLPLPGVDGIDQWSVISGKSTTTLRDEVFVGSGVLIQANYKLIATPPGEARWSGPLYPRVPATGSAKNLSCSTSTPC